LGAINEQTMSKTYVQIHITNENRHKLREECKQIFLKYHPEFSSIKITDDFIFERVITKYIEDDAT
jgi:hypothetical protein